MGIVIKDMISKLNVGAGMPIILSTIGIVLISPNKTQSTSISAFLAFEVIRIIPIANRKV